MVASMLERYMACKLRIDKSKTIFEVVDRIRELSGNGGFIKKDNGSGLYYEVGDLVAREKVSQAFRDAAFDHYKSSRHVRSKKKKDARSGSMVDESRKGSSQLSDLTLQPFSLSNLNTLELNQADKHSIDDSNGNAAVAHNFREIGRLENYELSSSDTESVNPTGFHQNTPKSRNVKYKEYKSYKSTCDETMSMSIPTPVRTRRSISNVQSNLLHYHEKEEDEWDDGNSSCNAVETKCITQFKVAAMKTSDVSEQGVDMLDDDKTFEMLLREVIINGSRINTFDDQTLDLLLEKLPTSNGLKGSDSEGSSSIETIDHIWHPNDTNYYQSS